MSDMTRLERYVLEYEVIYRERVRTEDHTSLHESVESHTCVLRFFTEDGTLEIVERPVANNGRTEKRLVKRHKVEKQQPQRQKPQGFEDEGGRLGGFQSSTVSSNGLGGGVTGDGGDGGLFVTAEDLYPGNVIVVYGMLFEVVRGTALADEYSTLKGANNSMLGLSTLTGGSEGGQQQQQQQQYTDSMAFDEFFAASGGGMEGQQQQQHQQGRGRPGTTGGTRASEFVRPRKDRVADWLTAPPWSQSPTTLSFDCVWDDSESLYGDVHHLKLHYALLDDTVDVVLCEVGQISDLRSSQYLSADS